MAFGKYYCDYCDKQFQDTPSARRRHLNGVAHQRAKAQWYDEAMRASTGLNQFHHHDPQSISGKGTCNRFLRTGSCPYGDSCKYYHPKNIPDANTQRMEATVLRNQMGPSLGNLPPSLWPPPEGGYPHLPFIDWG